MARPACTASRAFTGGLSSLMETNLSPGPTFARRTAPRRVSIQPRAHEWPGPLLASHLGADTRRAALSAHGGYLLRPEGLRSLDLVEVARSALRQEGEDPAEASLQVSVLRSPGVLRVAYDAPFTYGRRGALWYRDHHAFARLTSEHTTGAAHVYAIDADTFEAVWSYAKGHRVGGESVVYDELEMDFDDEEGLVVGDFEQM